MNFQDVAGKRHRTRGVSPRGRWQTVPVPYPQRLAARALANANVAGKRHRTRSVLNTTLFPSLGYRSEPLLLRIHPLSQRFRPRNRRMCRKKLTKPAMVSLQSAMPHTEPMLE